MNDASQIQFFAAISRLDSKCTIATNNILSANQITMDEANKVDTGPVVPECITLMSGFCGRYRSKVTQQQLHQRHRPGVHITETSSTWIVLSEVYWGEWFSHIHKLHPCG